MINRNDGDNEALLQQVIDYLRRQEIPAFPDPEIAAPKQSKGYASSVRSVSTLRRIAMNRRFQLSAGTMIGVAAVLGFILLWGGDAAQSLSAMEKMAESVRKAKSFKAAVTCLESIQAANAGNSPRTSKVVGTVYWLAPGSSHFDFRGSAPEARGGPSRDADITRINRSGEWREVIIDHKAKNFQKVGKPQKAGEAPLGPEIMEKLGEFSGQADRDLGIKKIGGKEAHGFEIEMKKIHRPPNAHAPSKDMAEVWIDAESSLPVLVQFNFNRDLKQMDVATGYLRLQDFQWNIDLDPKLFDTTVPKGYTDVTPKEPSVEERVRWFTDCLRLYVELTGGRDYPPANTILEAEASHKGLFKTHGFKWPSNANSPEVQQSGKFQKIQRVAGGLFGIASLVQFLNPDAAYYGKTVTPADKSKVLLRWKLDDGRYEVIFGDLHAATVTAEELRRLEK
jgi:hypothetical protein